MANVSEQIEKFIIATLGDNDSIDITRNSLAEFFSCVPSQINYVLETRFTVDRGYIVEFKHVSADEQVDLTQYTKATVLEARNANDDAKLKELIDTFVVRLGHPNLVLAHLKATNQVYFAMRKPIRLVAFVPLIKLPYSY